MKSKPVCLWGHGFYFATETRKRWRVYVWVPTQHGDRRNALCGARNGFYDFAMNTNRPKKTRGTAKPRPRASTSRTTVIGNLYSNNTIFECINVKGR